MSAPLSTDKPVIKILLYTDDPQISLSRASSEFFGLGSMIDRMQEHAPVFAEIKTTCVSRSSDNADTRIDVLLKREKEAGEPFDEIWFFGLHQANTDGIRGGKDSELDAAEVAALQQWMSTAEDFQGGGVLMTGDHANPVPPRLIPTPNGPCGDTSAGAEFLGLGRAIGRCVPRAGLLRKWEGAPTRRASDSFSTIFDATGFQLDRIPQQLDLQNVNLDGDVDPAGQPHPLFFYQPGKFIKSFPDHGHEGAVVLPDVFDPAVWPSGPNGQPRPQLVALGRDTRRPVPLNILATYNGDLAGVGRIVADSTWHHYMNLNLRGFQHPAPVGSDSDQIGQFYANLAIWLAPRSKRVQMARFMSWQLAQYTLLLEQRSDVETLGDTANSILATVASPCEIHELLQVLPPMDHGGFPSAETADESDQPPRELFLGVVLDAYHDAMVRAEDLDQEVAELEVADGLEANSLDELIKNALKRTFDEQEERLQRKLAAVTAAKNKQ